MSSKHALITGITGQDGSYLAELLLEKGYEVHGLVRRTSQHNYQNIEHILSDLHLIEGDMTDQGSLITALEKSRPDEIYNLAAQSHVGTSFSQPVSTTSINSTGVLWLLEAIRTVDLRDVRFYQASTSELYGNVMTRPQDEWTPMYPASPYALAKHHAHHMVRHYREAYGLFGCCGILFNHESPRRSPQFVTRKITQGLARMKYGLQETIQLGNIAASRDWGYAPDYVRAMWLMLQQEHPRDYVIATGETHSVREFLLAAVIAADFPLGDDLFSVDDTQKRPSDVHYLCGDASRARHEMGWKPSISFQSLVQIMVEEDMKACHSRLVSLAKR